MLQKRTLAKLITLIVVVSLAVLPSAAAPTATSPDLGLADSFAVLAGTPNITNVPTSAITGDVGLSPATGAGIGLTCAEVTGTIYDNDGGYTGGGGGSIACLVTDAALLTTAKTNLSNAYDALSAGANAACTVDYGAVTQELGGLTLVPGVYCADAFTLSGILTLNGADTDVWIFRSAYTLITSGAAEVVLSTGGIPCEVWWQVGSSATLGVDTSLAGNILALTSISLATRANLDGRALARNGAVTLDQNTIAIPICVLDVPIVTTEIHDANHVEIFSAPVGTIVHDMAMISGTLGITPTGTVTFTMYQNQTCTAPGIFAGAIPLVAIASGVSVADPSDTTTLTSAGLSYLAHYGGDRNYDPGDGPCEVLRPLAVPTVTTEIHDNVTGLEVTSAPTGTVVHDMARVTGTLGIPTGIVSFTVYHNLTCAAPGTFAGAVPLNAAGVADPSDTATLTSAGLSYLARYMGDANYIPADGPCEVLTVAPTAVELLYFQANPLSGQQVQLQWATALEVDNFGFNLYRAAVNDLRLASLIHFEPASTQGGGSGATYAYVDTAPYAGRWWYWLSDVDTYGRETFHNTPVNITVESNSNSPYRIYLPFVLSSQ